MNQLKYRFECLDGNYEINISFSDELTYEIKTDLPDFIEIVEILGKEKTEEFIKELELSGIERWNEEYVAEGSPIEDAVKWSVAYQKDDHSFFSKGEETYEPYGYEHLIRAIKMCDKKADYFLPGAE